MIRKCILVLFSLILFGCDNSEKENSRKNSGEDEHRTREQVLGDKSQILVHLAGEIQTAITYILIPSGANAKSADFISFETESLNGYHNEKCKSSSCLVFGDDKENKQVTYREPDISQLDNSFKDHFSFGKWIFTGSLCQNEAKKGEIYCHQDNIDNEELIAILPWMKKEYCEAISYSYGSVPPDRYEIVNVSEELLPEHIKKFTGTYADYAQIPQKSASRGCYSINYQDKDSYHFYQVLLRR